MERSYACAALATISLPLMGDVIAIDVENLQNMAQFLPLSQEMFS